MGVTCEGWEYAEFRVVSNTVTMLFVIAESNAPIAVLHALAMRYESGDLMSHTLGCEDVLVGYYQDFLSYFEQRDKYFQ